MKEIHILVDEESGIITVFDGDKKITLKGVIVFGADAELGASIALAYGCSADCAWGAAVQYQNRELRTFWSQLSAHIVKQIDPRLLLQTITPEEIETKWAENDNKKTTFN